MPDPGITWDSHSGDLFSRDLITFTVTPLEIITIARNAELVKIEIEAPIGMRVGIEYSPSMRARTWARIGEVAMSRGRGTFSDTDSVRLRLDKGFYRAVELPAVMSQ